MHYFKHIDRGQGPVVVRNESSVHQLLAISLVCNPRLPYDSILKRGSRRYLRSMASHRTEPKQERNEYVIAWR